MNKAIVSKTFSAQKYKDAELSVKAATVLEKMTNNDHFSDIQPKLDELKARLKSYDTALAETLQGGRLQTAIKRECRRNLEMSLQEVATYVQLTSKGDEVVISSSGFDMHKKAAKVGTIDQPKDVRITQVQIKGTVQVSCNRVDHARFYVFAYCEAPVTPESVWMQVTGSRRKIMIDGLTSGKEYCFKVAAARTDPSRVWSVEVNSFVI